MAQKQIRMFKVLQLDYYPRESHLVTFRDPYSFPLLFHPDCNDLVAKHLDAIAEKVWRRRVSLNRGTDFPVRSQESAWPSANTP